MFSSELTSNHKYGFIYYLYLNLDLIYKPYNLIFRIYIAFNFII